MNILVIGSLMMDQIVLTERMPRKGETIIGEKFIKMPGGKGANQAVAAARLGADIKMAGMVGDDENGQMFIDILNNENIDTSAIISDKTSTTGIGVVMTERNGDNRIIVIPGANLVYSLDDLKKIKEKIKKADLLILQLEIDLHVVQMAVNFAYEFGVEVLLNPAPAHEISDELLSKVTYLTPNETELEILTGLTVSNTSEAIVAAKLLLSKKVKNVIVTLGDKGALIVNKDKVNHIKGFAVKPVNTVAAGDAFNGGFAVQILNGSSIDDAVKYANAVGGLAVTKEGAIPSIPTKEEVEEFFKRIEHS